MIIDTHTHFYDPARPAGVPWPDAGSPLYRRVLPAHFRAAAGPCGVNGTLVIEASEWIEDNQWLLDLAADEAVIFGVVGRLEPADEDFAADLERFAAQRLFRGIRIRPETLEAAEASAAAMANLVELARRDLTLDLLGGFSCLPRLRPLIERAPALRVVVNHVGSAPDADGRLEGDWLRGLCAAAELPRVYCKLSGFESTAAQHHDPIPPEPSFYRPAFEAMLETLGAGRLLYASNWPVSESAADYASTFAIVSDWIASLSADEGRQIWSGNARRAYGPLRGE